jgi:membrane carboxypeptidase/penicillin-binding protein PbpC
VKPQSIKAVEVCSQTGSVASDDCPKKEKGDFIKGISSPRPCTIHRRGADGKVVALDESEKKSFKIISPENNALFHLVEAGLSERIVFRLVGAKDNERFWWFVDGVAGGESLGNEAFVLEMEEGDHSVIAVNGTGESSRVDFKILRSAKNRGKK